MKGWKELVLSLPGLPVGVTEIKTTVTTDFFTQFEQSPIAGASYDVRLLLDKKPGLYILNIEAKGWHETNCDRCLVRIKIPGQSQYQYFFNQGSGSMDQVDKEDEDLIILEEGVVELDLRPMVYEAIVLSMPMINVYDCENDDQPPCDFRVLEILREKETEEKNSTNPTWDVLKNIKFED